MDWDVLAHGYGLAEAPTIDADGSLVFSDVLGGGVYRLDAVGERDHGRTEAARRRRHRDPRRRRDRVLGSRCRARTRGRRNAHGVARRRRRRDGTICAPTRPGWSYAGALRFAVFDPGAEEVPGELWRVAADGDAAVVFGDVVHANGVAVSTDGSTIYLSDSRRRRIIVFDVARATCRDHRPVRTRASRRDGARRERCRLGGARVAVASPDSRPTVTSTRGSIRPRPSRRACASPGASSTSRPAATPETPTCAVACCAPPSTSPAQPSLPVRV